MHAQIPVTNIAILSEYCKKPDDFRLQQCLCNSIHHPRHDPLCLHIWSDVLFQTKPGSKDSQAL